MSELEEAVELFILASDELKKAAIEILKQPEPPSADQE